MSLKLVQVTVGPWPMNAYVLLCDNPQAAAVVDPGADPTAILAHTGAAIVEKILITHGHHDHVGALEQIRAATGAPVYMHPADAEKFGIHFDYALEDGDEIAIGRCTLKVIHTPGHTPGMTSFDLGEGRVIVGDTLFVGGPGRTENGEDFETTMHTMQHTVFTWPGGTRFYPGHGPAGTIGAELPSFKAFVRRGWSPDTHGDVTW